MRASLEQRQQKAMSFFKLFGLDQNVEELREELSIPEGIFGGSRVMITTDPTHPGLRQLQPNRQRVAYLVLPDEEIQLGLIRPLRLSYQHVVCGRVTRIGLTIAQTFARQPSFYTSTFCAACKGHFPLTVHDDSGAIPEFQFFWEDSSPVGR
jgi:hypothetical protein